MRACGLAIATANARPQAKAAAHYVTPNSGGHGAGRDAIDFILAAQGKLDSAIEAFLDADNPTPPQPTSAPAGCNAEDLPYLRRHLYLQCCARLLVLRAS